ncbi:MAG: type II and III secretion system protein family protein [Nitrospirae bacterium]|nr:MAG: type II and III secretion system protein family protein [Nitrospirota bacterium]
MSAALFIALELSAISAFAEELTPGMPGVRAPQIVQLAVGGSIIIDSPTPIGRASLANPDVASTIVLSPTQIYLTGKTIGTTTLTLWDQRKSLSRVYTVQVIPDLTRLKRQLHEVFPNEQKVRVTAGHDNVALSGTVSSTEVLGKILAMAEPYAPQKVVNLLQVGGVQQVMLEVHIAEMNRQLARRLGINFSRLRSGNNFFFGELNDLSELTLKDGAFEFVASAVVNATLGIPVGKDLYLIFLDFLKQHNLSRVLAEPTLVAISGQEAEFLAGGEFPIPVPQAFGVTTIKFKEFGVRLGFKPTVLHDGKISLKITPEVSELDFANGVNSQGFTIPAITTRRASTVLELADGQSFAIAGLLQDNIRETIAKYPVLGDIPILGTLFRSTQFQKNETELIIIVTPRLVKPLDLAHQTLPTDSYLEPNDFELMLLGYLEGVPHVPRTDGIAGARSETGPLTWHQGGLEGPFGHLAPEMTDVTMGRSP